MTRQEQLSVANEITVLCGIVSDYISSFCPPTTDAIDLRRLLEEAAPTFLELTDGIVDDGSPRDLQLCPQCGENLGAAVQP